MPPQIFSITEAFSMQPQTFEIGSVIVGGQIKQFKRGGPDNEDIFALDENGKLLAEYRSRSVNIHYS